MDCPKSKAGEDDTTMCVCACMYVCVCMSVCVCVYVRVSMHMGA